MRRSRTTLVLAAGALALAATAANAGGRHDRTEPCQAHLAGGDWRAYGHDVAQTRDQTDEHALDATSGHLVWRHAIGITAAGLGGGIVGATIVVDDLVVVLVNETGDGTTGPYLLALDA